MELEAEQQAWIVYVMQGWRLAAGVNDLHQPVLCCLPSNQFDDKSLTAQMHPPTQVSPPGAPYLCSPVGDSLSDAIGEGISSAKSKLISKCLGL